MVSNALVTRVQSYFNFFNCDSSEFWSFFVVLVFQVATGKQLLTAAAHTNHTYFEGKFLYLIQTCI